VAQQLGIAAGAPVMVLDRVVMSLDGRPIEWRVGRCHLADKYYVAEMA
jgi:GntR family transcriptional regulator